MFTPVFAGTESEGSAQGTDSVSETTLFPVKRRNI